MAEHAWCRSPARDEAVRAAEDGRSGPLPTLEEAIAAVTERRPQEPGGGGNVTGFTEPVKCSPALNETGETQSGLRTERVTLEVTMPTSHLPLHPEAWPWKSMLSKWGFGYSPGESVRVVTYEERKAERLRECAVSALDQECEEAFLNAERLTRERDAAIRERDELRSQVQILDEGQPTAPSDLGVWCTAKDLSARCKELAASLVTTAVRASSSEARVAELEGCDWVPKSAPAASGAAGTEVGR